MAPNGIVVPTKFCKALGDMSKLAQIKAEIEACGNANRKAKLMRRLGRAEYLANHPVFAASGAVVMGSLTIIELAIRAYALS